MRKSIETSGDILVATLTHHILRGSKVLNPVECTQDHSARDLGLLRGSDTSACVYNLPSKHIHYWSVVRIQQDKQCCMLTA